MAKGGYRLTKVNFALVHLQIPFCQDSQWSNLGKFEEPEKPSLNFLVHPTGWVTHGFRLEEEEMTHL